MKEKLLTEKEAAAILGIKPSTLSARRGYERYGGGPSVPPFITTETGNIRYLESSVLKVKAEGFQRKKRTLRQAGNTVTQLQAIILTGLSKECLDCDHRNGGKILPVRSSASTLFYPLEGIKDYLIGHPDRLLCVDRAAKALNVPRQRLDDDRRNSRKIINSFNIPYVTVDNNEANYLLSDILEFLIKQTAF